MGCMLLMKMDAPFSEKREIPLQDPLAGYVGTWTALDVYEYNGMLYTIKNEIYANCTGLSFWTNQYGVADKPWEMVWYPYKENTYINYYKEALIHFTILPD